MSQHVFSSGLLRKGILWYFLSFFVQFPRHWQLNQLRLDTAGIESHALRQGHANVAPWQKRTPETRKTSTTICKISCQTLELHMAAAQHLKLWEVVLGKQVAGSPWSNARQQLSACSEAQRKPSMLKKTHKTHKNIHGKFDKNWRGKTCIKNLSGTRCAESQIQVCCRRVAARQIAKNAENPLSAHLSLQSLCSQPRDEESIKHNKTTMISQI